MLIKDMIPNNDEFVGYYLLKTVEAKNAQNGSPFFELTLSDKSGTITAKMWDISQQDKETFFPLKLVKVKGTCQLYKEKSQVIVKQMRLVKEEDNVSPLEYVKVAPVPPADLLHIIEQAVNKIQNEKIRTIVQFCIDRVGPALMHAPAAMKHHHAYYAGLAYHMSRMLELGEFMLKQRPVLNGDLLRAGIVLHDIAKPLEADSQLGIITEYTLEGQLIGHIVMVNDWITEAAIINGYSLKDEVIIALKHIVLSHHGKLEYGSPQYPKLLEAIALHMIDNIDASLQAGEDTLEDTPAHEPWTPKIKMLENQALYRFKI